MLTGGKENGKMLTQSEIPTELTYVCGVCEEDYEMARGDELCPACNNLMEQVDGGAFR